MRLNKNNKEIFKLVTICLILFIFNLWKIRDITIWQESDVFGFWSSAAFFTGKNWSGITSAYGYFSYGYGFLLIPLFLFFNNIITMYKVAIIINVFLVCIIFIINYKICRRFCNVSENKSIFMSFLVVLYPSYIAQSNVAWSEILLAFIIWCLFYLFLSMLKSKKVTLHIILIAILLGYLYMIHQRTLGIVIAGFLTITLMLVFRNITNRQYVLFILSLSVLLIIQDFLKKFIQANVWNNSTQLVVNDYGGQIDKILRLFSKDGLINTIEIFSGQAFYIGCSTFLIAYVGIWYLTKYVLKNLFYKIKKGSKIICLDFFGYTFILLSVLFTSIISAIFMNGGIGRIDVLFYGRYNEMTIGPILLLGIYELIQNPKYNLKKWLFCSGILIIFILIASFGYDHISNNEFQTNKAVALSLYYYLGAFHYKLATIITIVISGILFFLYRNNIKYKFSVYMPIFLCAICFCFIGKNAVSKMIFTWDSFDFKDVYSIYNYINDKEINANIYYLKENEINPYYSGLLQFLLMDMKVIDKDEINTIADNSLIVTRNIADIFENTNINGYKMDYSTAYFSLWEKDKRDLKIKKSNKVHIPLRSFKSQNKDENADIIQSNGASGFLLYGPYITLDKANYDVNVTCELLYDNIENIGYIEVVSGDNNYQRTEINKSNFNYNIYNGTLKLSIPVKTSQIEIRLYINKGVILRVNKVSITKNPYS